LRLWGIVVQADADDNRAGGAAAAAAAAAADAGVIRHESKCSETFTKKPLDDNFFCRRSPPGRQPCPSGARPCSCWTTVSSELR